MSDSNGSGKLKISRYKFYNKENPFNSLFCICFDYGITEDNKKEIGIALGFWGWTFTW